MVNHSHSLPISRRGFLALRHAGKNTHATGQGAHKGRQQPHSNTNLAGGGLLGGAANTGQPLGVFYTSFVHPFTSVVLFRGQITQVACIPSPKRHCGPKMTTYIYIYIRVYHTRYTTYIYIIYRCVYIYIPTPASCLFSFSFKVDDWVTACEQAHK